MTLTIKNKMLATSVLSAFGGLALVFGVFLFYQTKKTQNEEDKIQQRLELLAKVIGNNIGPVLALEDSATIYKELDDFQADPLILGIAVYQADGTLFSHYENPRNTAMVSFPRAFRPGDALLQKGDDVLSIAQPIRIDGNQIGFIRVLGDLRQLKTHLQSFLMLMLGTLVVSTILSFGLASVMQKGISRPIRHLSEVAREILQENSFSSRARIKATGEIGLLIKSFNKMLDELQGRSEQKQRDRELKTALNSLGQITRGGHDTATLAQGLISFLAQRMNALVGAFYVREEKEYLRLAATYAFKPGKEHRTRFKMGEGLVGQAALEKRAITIDKVPPDYLKIVSGLGNLTPRWILLFPLMYEDFVKGVVEIGFIDPPAEEHTVFMEQGAEIMGVALQVAAARQRMLALYNESQKRALALETANRDLQDQTEALQASETRLREQQEELQAANEQLQEKTQALEHQQAEIQNKNQALKSAHSEIEEKAAHLESVSNYKSQFLANMSHELRTPLNSLLLLAKGLEDNREGNLTPDQIEDTRIIYQSGQDLLSLINDILDLSKIEAGRLDILPQDISFKTLLARIRRAFEPIAAKKGLEFKCALEPAIPAGFVSDEKRLEQILKNLLSNAFKFTSAGRVGLSVHPPRAGTPYPPEWLGFSVEDTGIGIDPNKHQHIFEAFRQADGSTNREYGGTGLGLTISRQLAQLLNGYLDFSSEPGSGSTFTLYLPPTMEMPGTPGSIEDLETPHRKPLDEKVPVAIARPEPAPVDDDRDLLWEEDHPLLIIEDDPHFAQILANLARQQDLKCLVAATGERGLVDAIAFQPFGIILDIGLPGMDGWSVLHQLKNRPVTRHIPVHIISAREENLVDIQQGAIGYLKKPVTGDDIFQVFTKLEKFSANRLKSILLVEDDPETQIAIKRFLENEKVTIDHTDTAEKALEMLPQREYDCIILDLRLPGMSGLEFLRKIQSRIVNETLPVIIYTGKDLSRDELLELRKYSESIVIKGSNSPDRLLDEVTLFLHQVVDRLPPEQQKSILRYNDTAAILKGKRILLVDDDMRNLFALSKQLRAHGMEVVKAENGQAAIDILMRHPRIDLILMDLMMPVMDGLTAMRKIRALPKYKNLPILALTAKAMAQDREECIKAGADDFLPKPIDIEKLLSSLRVWLYSGKAVAHA